MSYGYFCVTDHPEQILPRRSSSRDGSVRWEWNGDGTRTGVIVMRTTKNNAVPRDKLRALYEELGEGDRAALETSAGEGCPVYRMTMSREQLDELTENLGDLLSFVLDGKGQPNAPKLVKGMNLHWKELP